MKMAWHQSVTISVCLSSNTAQNLTVEYCHDPVHPLGCVG